MKTGMNYGHDAVKIARYMVRLAADRKARLTPMQVLKLVYIAHGWQLGLYSMPLVSNSIEAWPYGPVIPEVYHHYKKYGGGVIKAIPTELPSGLTSDEESTTVQVFEGYGHRTGVSLSSLTHEAGSPWSVTVQQSGIGAVISTDLIEDYYRRQSLRA